MRPKGAAMARGRIIRKKISIDKKIAALANEHGAEAALFFTWLIPHLDRDGRAIADPDLLKGLVAPRVKSITVDTIATALRFLSERGVVVIYEHDDEQYLYMPKFEENQLGMRRDREAPSELPDPAQCQSNSGAAPESLRSDSGPTPDQLRSDSGPRPAERKGKERNQTETTDGLLDAAEDLDEIPMDEIERIAVNSFQLPVGAGLTGLHKLMALKPILAWEARGALAATIEKKPKSPIAYMASVIVSWRRENRSPPPKAKAPKKQIDWKAEIEKARAPGRVPRRKTNAEASES